METSCELRTCRGFVVFVHAQAITGPSRCMSFSGLPITTAHSALSRPSSALPLKIPRPVCGPSMCRASSSDEVTLARSLHCTVVAMSSGGWPLWRPPRPHPTAVRAFLICETKWRIVLLRTPHCTRGKDLLGARKVHVLLHPILTPKIVCSSQVHILVPGCLEFSNEVESWRNSQQYYCGQLHCMKSIKLSFSTENTTTTRHYY